VLPLQANQQQQHGDKALYPRTQDSHFNYLHFDPDASTVTLLVVFVEASVGLTALA